MPLSKRDKIFLISLIRLRKRRECWVRPILQNRNEKGYGSNLVEEMRLSDEESFFNFFRMTPAVFEQLLNMVGPSIQRKNTNFRDSISAKDRLALTLRFLASGDLMRSISYSFRVSPAVTSTIIASVCGAIASALEPVVLKPPEKNDWFQTAEGFLQKWQFPHCLGALDGKHVVLQAPANSGSEFFNYKGQFSMVLMAVADANYKFVVVDIGEAGHQSDGAIFAKSVLGRAMSGKTLDIPPPDTIPGTIRKLPFVFVADEAFPLKENLLRPYPGSKLDSKKRVFNYRLSRARRCIENAFGIMASRFRILSKPIQAKLSTTECIIKSIVCLHNYLINADQNSSGRKFYCPEGFSDTATPNVSQDGGMFPLRRAGSNNYAKLVLQIRENFGDHFINEGAVDWQDAAVNKK